MNLKSELKDEKIKAEEILNTKQKEHQNKYEDLQKANSEAMNELLSKYEKVKQDLEDKDENLNNIKEQLKDTEKNKIKVNNKLRKLEDEYKKL